MDKVDGAVEALSTLNGANNTVTLSSGKVVTIKVCNGRVLPKLLQTVSKLAGDLGLDLRDARAIESKLLDKFSDVSFILQLISNYTADAYLLIAGLTDLENTDAVADLPLDDLTAVAVKVVEVNRRFFTEKVLPAVPRGVVEKMESAATQ